MTTYKEMTVEHLGDNATEDDLTAFRNACEARQRDTGASDADVTEEMWNNGDWYENVTRCGF